MRYPVTNPESARNAMEMNITRVRAIARVSTAGFVRRYPGAASGTRRGAARIPSTARAHPISSTMFRVLVATRRVSSAFPLASTSAMAGMNTMLRTPPRNSRCTKNGTAYAITNADLAEVAPKRAAMMTSRTSPSPRLATVLAAMTPAARASRAGTSARCGGAGSGSPVDICPPL